MRSLCVLLPLVGCTWISGIFYVNKSMAWIQYIFAICNGLQVNKFNLHFLKIIFLSPSTERRWYNRYKHIFETIINAINSTIIWFGTANLYLFHCFFTFFFSHTSFIFPPFSYAFVSLSLSLFSYTSDALYYFISAFCHSCFHLQRRFIRRYKR
jgi:hypothetical protein